MNHTLEPLKLLVVGKTGVGKSAFCNFLFGEERFKSANGKPVTKNIQSHKFKLSNTDIIVYDTEGIEMTNIEKWKEQTQKVIGYSDKETKNIHGIFYIINASSARIEPFEINFIEKTLSRYRIPFYVILTHIDVAKPEELQSLTLILKKIKGINIIPICTIQKKLRGGRTKISNEELENLHQKLVTSFLKVSGKYYLYHNMFIVLEQFRHSLFYSKYQILQEISNADFSIFNVTDWEDKLDNTFSNIEKYMDKEISKVGEIQLEAESLFYNLLPQTKADLDMNIFVDMDIDFNIEELNGFKNIQNNIDSLEDDSGFFSKTGAIFSLSYKALTAESRIKELVEEVFNLIESNILTKEELRITRQFNKEVWVDTENNF